MNQIKIERLKKFYKELEQENSDLKKEIETLKPKPKIAKGKLNDGVSSKTKKKFQLYRHGIY
jgi:cell division protein FtsB